MGFRFHVVIENILNDTFYYVHNHCLFVKYAHIFHNDILNLEKEIIHIEKTLIDFLNLKHEKGIKKSLHQLESNLRYLSILANGVPINKNQR